MHKNPKFGFLYFVICRFAIFPYLSEEYYGILHRHGLTGISCTGGAL
jgi:hypothetical protein